MFRTKSQNDHYHLQNMFILQENNRSGRSKTTKWAVNLTSTEEQPVESLTYFCLIDIQQQRFRLKKKNWNRAAGPESGSNQRDAADGGLAEMHETRVLNKTPP